jgi:hypothetical protein
MASSLKKKTKAFAVGAVKKILLVGCGGTGSFLAEHLCRMITGFRLPCGLMLADGDTVEPANIWRQNFTPHEIGQNKAAALGLRLSGRFGLPISVIDGFIKHADTLLDADGLSLVITATDTLGSRKTVANAEPALWLDVGNGRSMGQAVIGTASTAEPLRKIYWGWEKQKGYIAALPTIAAMNPAILTARKARKRAGCGQMPFAEQGFGINAMAALAASVLAKQAVVEGVVTTVAIYFDTATGRMTPRLIDKDLFRLWMRKD